jgi:iron only hydrogenase large subunit-like protein
MYVKNEEKSEMQPHMEVDTVLATHELLELFSKLDIDFLKANGNQNEDEEMKDEQEFEGSHNLLPYILNKASSISNFHINSLYNRQSNGYLEFILRKAKSDIFGQEADDPQKELEYV